MEIHAKTGYIDSMKRLEDYTEDEIAALLDSSLAEADAGDTVPLDVILSELRESIERMESKAALKHVVPSR
jgi:hypothetical protein